MWRRAARVAGTGGTRGAGVKMRMKRKMRMKMSMTVGFTGSSALRSSSKEVHDGARACGRRVHGAEAAYPTDDMGAELNGSLTFSELVAGDTFDQDIYEVLGVGDSLVRERVFQETASRTGASYQDVYEYFIEGHPLPYPICRDLGSRGPDGDLDEIAADADVAAAMNTPISRGDFDALDADAIESAQLLQSKATTGFPWGFGAI